MAVQEIKRLRETADKVEFKEAKKVFNFAGGSHADPKERRKCVLGYAVALAHEGGAYLFWASEKRRNYHTKLLERPLQKTKSVRWKMRYTNAYLSE